MGNKETLGLISNIQKFSVNDGPGIRTIIFFKGCFANCPWCCNPETIEPKVEIGYSERPCIGCETCKQNCPKHAIKIENNSFILDRRLCDLCGICAQGCPTNAIEIIGKLMSIEEILEIVARDKPFYDISNGGITISGGEPFYQFPFLMHLLKNLKEKKYNIAIETTGNIEWSKFKKALNFIDYLLYDLKILDNKRLGAIVGIDNYHIKNNLIKSSKIGIPIILRVPLIPEYTSKINNIQNIADFIKDLDNILEINLLPYHKLGLSKYKRIGKIYKLDHLGKIEPHVLNNIIDIFRSSNKGIPIHCKL